MAGPKCIWPGCTEGVKESRSMCYRHFSRLPQRLKGWLAAKFDRVQMGVSGSEAARVYHAVRGWARVNPDPALPPFKRNDVVQGKAGGIFKDNLYLVDTCVLNDEKKWVVISDMGDTLPAEDVEMVDDEKKV